MKRFALAALAAFALASPAHAIVLVPGPGTFSPDVFAAPSGPVLASILDAPFVSSLGASDFFGRYSTEVIADSARGGELDFLYVFTNSALSVQDLNRVTGSGFAGFTTDVGYVVGAGDTPNSVDRTTANPIGWNWLDGVAPGASSDILEVQTNATLFTAGNFSLIDDGTSTNAAFEPTAVPEAPSWAMALLGFAVLAFTARRRRAGLSLG
jgi:MYXO-CTERM domain-containing protein